MEKELYTEIMRCPNCYHALLKKKIGQIQVDHCEFCGGTIFEENEINRITTEQAQTLAEAKKSDVISGNEKFSPRDGSPLKRIEDESIPQFVTLLKSDSTGEVFVYPEDLVNFKKAQQAKIDYFKLWHIPLPALKTVLVYSFVLVTTLSIVYSASVLNNPTSKPTRATSICDTSLEVFAIDSQFIVACKTDTVYTSVGKAQCPAGEVNIQINSQPSYSHIANVPLDCTRFQFIFNDKGNTTSTEWIDLKK